MRTGKEWREFTAQKRKWKEQKLLKQLEKAKKKKEAEEDTQNEEVDDVLLGRQYTVSIALPGSILDNAQTPELKAYLAGQIARAAVIFNIDEIIVFDETGSGTTSLEEETDSKKGRCNLQLARILQYLECPQYLRKNFFPMHKDLQYAGLLNPLDCPHHMKADDESLYREGVVTEKPTGQGSVINVGLLRDVIIDRKLQAGLRVTVKMTKRTGKKLKGVPVAPSEPRTHAGLYWGYNVRLASSLSAVFSQAAYKGGYDVTIGTSDKGDCVDEFEVPSFQHALVVFGGVQGLEASLDADELLTVDEPRPLFDHYLNTCPNQGSKTIRTEEAILVTLSALRPMLNETVANTSRDSIS